VTHGFKPMLLSRRVSAPAQTIEAVAHALARLEKVYTNLYFE
jgi:hypothetical protein